MLALGSRFWRLTKSEHDAIDELFAAPSLRRLSTALLARDDDAPLEVLDAAYWMKGCSSLGLRRYAVRLGIGMGKSGTLR